MEQWNSVKNPPETKVSHKDDNVINTTITRRREQYGLLRAEKKNVLLYFWDSLSLFLSLSLSLSLSSSLRILSNLIMPCRVLWACRVRY
jgi:hypothetical protein